MVKHQRRIALLLLVAQWAATTETTLAFSPHGGSPVASSSGRRKAAAYSRYAASATVTTTKTHGGRQQILFTTSAPPRTAAVNPIGTQPLSPPLPVDDFWHRLNTDRSRSDREAERQQQLQHVRQRRQRRSRRSGRVSSGREGADIRYSAGDWLYNLRTLPNSTVLREILNPVATITAWSTFVSIVYKGLVLSGRGAVAANLSVPTAAHSFLVSSLGLLLVFRTNSAYQRFQEGRKIWENILTESRNLSRLVTLYRNEAGESRVARIKNLVATFPYLLRHHLRAGCLCNDKYNDEHVIVDDQYKLTLKEPSRVVVDTRYEGDDAVSSGGMDRPDDISVQYINDIRPCVVDRRDLPWRLLDSNKDDSLQKVSQAVNRPLWICDRLGKEIMDIPASDMFTSRERLSLIAKVDKLSYTIGEGERIRQTAVPLHYARHALRSLTIWLLTLPFALVKDLGVLTGPVTGIVAWLLFGVYQIGHSIEDPFQGSLRLSALCDAIHRDVLEDDDDHIMIGSRRSAFEVDNSDDSDDGEGSKEAVVQQQQQKQDAENQHAASSLPQNIILPRGMDTAANQELIKRLIMEQIHGTGASSTTATTPTLVLDKATGTLSLKHIQKA